MIQIRLIILIENNGAESPHTCERTVGDELKPEDPTVLSVSQLQACTQYLVL
jgi:hypothetical protein